MCFLWEINHDVVVTRCYPINLTVGGVRDAGCGVRGAEVGRLILWLGLDPYMGQRTTPKFIALENDNCNVYRNAEIDIFLRDVIQRADLTH
jgi:hypothetical protein